MAITNSIHIYTYIIIPLTKTMMNHTATLGIFAALAATMLMVGTVVVMPAFALISGDPQSTSSDGNTITIFKNKAKSIASGFGTIASNQQSNTLPSGGL